MKVRTALVLALAAAAVGSWISTSVAGAARSAPLPVIPPVAATMPGADPLYDQWEQAWIDTCNIETDIVKLRHQITFLQVMHELNLSKEQLQALRPIAKQARADGKFALELLCTRYQRWHDPTVRYWQDIMVEDLTPRKPTPVVNGNYDAAIWNAGQIGHHPGLSEQKEYPTTFDLKHAAIAFEKLLTPEQHKRASASDPVIGAALQAERKFEGYGHIPMVIPGWLYKTFEVVEVYQDWRKEIPAADVRRAEARPILMAVLYAPGALNWIEDQLGVEKTVNDFPEEDALTYKSWILLKYVRRCHHRQIVSANWMKGMQVTPAQTAELEPIARDLTKLCIGEAQDYTARGKVVRDNLLKIRDALLAGKVVPAEWTKVDAELGPKVAWCYATGPMQAELSAQDGTYMPRTSGFWTLYPKESEALMTRAVGVLSEAQRTVLWDAHGDCYMPWNVFTNPVNAGAPAVSFIEPPKLAELRRATGEQARAIRNELLAAAKNPKEAAAALDRAVAMSDADYQLHKVELAAPITGNPNAYGDDPSGRGTAEQNGEWPKVDWSDPKKHPCVWGNYTHAGRVEARLEFLMLPDGYHFLHVRNQLYQQFRPESPADLDKLPSLGAR